MKKKEKITVYHRLSIAILGALIGFFITLIVVALSISGSVTFVMMGKIACIGAVIFALLGYIFPKKTEKVLFVIALFQ